MVLPYQSKNPPESAPIATCTLIALNVIIYGVTSNFWEIREPILKQWGLTARNFDFVHVMTSMFLHGDVFHLLGNMWFLYLFGFAVEGRLRTPKFLTVYFIGGFAGDLLHHLIAGQGRPDMPSIGASGAIMAVLGAALLMFPFAKVAVFYWFGLFWRGVFDCPMWGVGIWYLGFDLLWALIGAMDGVGHLAHLGGAVGGFLVAAIFRPKRDSELVSDAKATMAETDDLRTLSRMELSELHRVNPEDPVILLNWVHRSSRDPGGIREDCRDAFVSRFGKLLTTEDPRQLSSALMMLPEASVPPMELMKLAAKLEQAQDATSAAHWYERVLHHPNATDRDDEAAAFRVALIADTVFRDAQRAKAWYGYVIQHWPMGPFAAQAKARLTAMGHVVGSTH